MTSISSLLISSLYPHTQPADGRTHTLALHNMVKYWNSYGKVIVVCPVYLYLKELITGKSGSPVKKSLKKEVITIDDVTVIVYPIFKIPKIAYFYYPLYKYLNRYLKSIGFTPDIIIAHYDKSLNIGYNYAKMKKLPFVAGLHIAPDLMEDTPGAFTKRCGKILDSAAAIACRSNYIYNKISHWFPQYNEKSFIAFSGVEEEIIIEPETAIQKMKRWKHTGKVSIITVSGLIERKKIDTNLNALALLNDKIDWTYTIIGEGAERSNLEALAAELRIKDRVRFTGSMDRKDVIEEMKRSDIFPMVSRMETFGLAYLEAMATGNIVIGAAGEGIDGVIEDGKNGFLSPSGDVRSLAETLERIVNRLSETRLEDILKESHRTIISYTDKNAAFNYWNHLKHLEHLKYVKEK